MKTVFNIIIVVALIILGKSCLCDMVMENEYPMGGVVGRVFGFSSSDIYLPGYETVWHFDGTSWSQGEKFTKTYFFDVWGPDPENLFAVGDQSEAGESNWGIIAHFDGRKWERMPTKIHKELRSVHGSGTDNVYAVGGGGGLYHYDGKDWGKIVLSELKGVTLLDVWVTESNDVFVVGKNGTIAHFDGESWNKMESGTKVVLRGLWGFSGGNLYAMGNENTLLHYDGKIWTSVKHPSFHANLEAGWSPDGKKLVVVGSRYVTDEQFNKTDHFQGVILKFDGQSWDYEVILDELQSVWGISEAGLYMTSYSKLFQYNGQEVQVMK